jgi:hypothetical protein
MSTSLSPWPSLSTCRSEETAMLATLTVLALAVLLESLLHRGALRINV